MPTEAECAQWGYPDGLPVLVVTDVDGSTNLYPAGTTRLTVRFPAAWCSTSASTCSTSRPVTGEPHGTAAVHNDPRESVHGQDVVTGVGEMAGGGGLAD
jgi:hypothetical protein